MAFNGAKSADFAMEALTQGLSMLKVKEITRQSNRFSQPDLRNVSEFELLGRAIIKCTLHCFNNKRREFVTSFGIPPIVMAKVWEMISEHETSPNPKMKKKHLMWAFYFLKVYPDMKIMGASVKQETERRRPDEKTIYKWIWIAIEAISDLHPNVIVWENRKTNDNHEDCLAGIDTIDCPFQQILCPNIRKPGHKKRNKAFMAKKLNGPGLRYEIASALRSSDIVNISGPYLPGEMNDLSIFRAELKWMLDAGEQVEADDIYVGESPEFVKCQASLACIGNEESQSMRRRAQGRIEGLMGHMANWNCLDKPFKGHGSPEERIEKHGKMFYACAVIKQISMEMGFNELWSLGDAYDSCI